MDKTRIAVAGAGYIGIEHIGVTRRSPACSLSAVVDPSPGAVEVAARAGVPLYRSLGELFEKDPPDGVVLATPNRFHVEHALACMQAGMPMLLEKPIAPTVEEAELVVRKADDAGVRILIGHHRAHSPIIARAKEFIDAGPPRRARRRDGERPVFQAGTLLFGRAVAKRAGRGANSAQHDPRGTQSTHAMRGNRCSAGVFVHATRKFQVEDTVAINFRFARGALGTVPSIRHSSKRAQLGALSR